MDPFEPTPEEKQQALIQALSGQQGATSADFMRGWGNILGQGAGALGEMGQGQVKQGMQLDQSRQAGLGQALQLALENQRQANTERHQQMQEDLQRQQISQGRWSLSNPGYGQPYKIDGKTGAIVPVGEFKEKPAAGGLGEKDIAKQLEEFQSKIAPESTRKLLGQLEQNLIRAEELQKFVKDTTGKTLNLTPQQMREATTMFAQAVQQGGQPAIAQIEHLNPDTLGQRWANWKQLVTGDPQGANAQQFIEQLLGSVMKAKGVAEAEQRRLILKQIPAYVHLRKYVPDQFNSVLKNSAGVDPATINDVGGLIEQPGEAGAGGQAHPPGWDDASEAKLKEIEARVAKRNGGGK